MALGIGLVAACGGSPSPGAPATSAPPPAASTPATAAPAAQAGPAATSGGTFKIADVFPPGNGRELVLNTCGSCHSIVCSTRDQRTAARWDSIMQGHKDKVTGLSDADLTTLFTYLKTNFNDTKPEPVVPAELLQQGCTPF